MEQAARQQFEFENNITLVDPTKDGLYSLDAAEQKAFVDTKPWASDPHYFKHVKISALALLKMTMHARSGGSIEVMGLMQGKIAPHTFVITDAFILPVEGTETRVNAQEQAYEFMGAYADSTRNSPARMENVIGWYHSHPGYGCWLSGIDVTTQYTQQQFIDPFLAIVVDPDRTISAGKVEIGAFRTVPEGTKGSEQSDGYQTIPLAKIEDFGAHAGRYYSLDIEIYKSTLDGKLLDLLWNKYWVQTLSGNPLIANREYGTKQIGDLAQKIHRCGEHQSQPQGGRRGGGGGKTVVHDSALEKVVKDSTKITSEEIAGLMSSVIKERVFRAIQVGQQPQP
ncbi:Mov34-domain-containing protein [Ascodesmis nigricans]|uniref:COP9 signalosome complex subunit 5 n=1 Tax=Ascodesmis nigricans TaxID=341454 RepID=A0A4S2N488_9PEZI|nr:Mov34-domain-containing protein [Ascodesmis nigricans]